MANYGIKYMAEWTNTRHQDYRLVIFERDYDGSYKRIRYFAGCSLEVQGAQKRIIDPIVKTQLRFSIVDAWDENDGPASKAGNWQEFFTPDATLYKVVLYSLEGNTETAIWSGYITPDSWHEDLDYRGIITVTARDNIGHLKDFPFAADGSITPDANGLIEIRWLLERAMEVIDFPMTFYVESAGSGQYSADVPETEDGDYLTEACVNASVFEGMDWYDVLERTLDSIGFAMRFVGKNTVVAGSLRNLPKVGHYSDATGSQTMEFYGGSLELDPAVKQIREEVDFGAETSVEAEILKGLTFGGDAADYRCKVDGNTLPGGGVVTIPEHDAPRDYIVSAGSTKWISGRDLLNPDDYLPDTFLKRSEGDNWKNYAFIPSNRVTDPVRGTALEFASRTAAAKLIFNFTPHALTIEDWGSEAGRMRDRYYSLASIRYKVSYSSMDRQTVRWWDGGGWRTSSLILEKTYDAQNQYETEFVVELGDCPDIDTGWLQIEFVNIVYKCWSGGGKGSYARLASLRSELIAPQTLQGDVVTTINNNAYNVKIDRKPLFGALSKTMGFLTPQNYKNGLFFYEVGEAVPSLFPYMVRFSDYAGGVVPLPVLIHEQILCYFFGAARVLSGNCAPVNKAKFDFGKLCSYKGVSYLFQGGTLDLFSGIITGAVLREYASFSDLWDGGAPDYSEDVIYNS